MSCSLERNGIHPKYCKVVLSICIPTHNHGDSYVLLSEIVEAICSNHLCPRSVVVSPDLS